MGHAVAKFVEALLWKAEVRGLDWNFVLIFSFPPHYGPGIISASNKNDYQVYFLGLRAADVLG